MALIWAFVVTSFVPASRITSRLARRVEDVHQVSEGPYTYYVGISDNDFGLINAQAVRPDLPV